MKKGFSILALAAALLLSCGSRSGERGERTMDSGQWRMENEVEVEAAEGGNDGSDVLQQTEATEAQGYGSTASRRSYSSDVEEDDNMRHFDPASEDDMDDNGMSRFMDNNDDEGWD